MAKRLWTVGVLALLSGIYFGARSPDLDDPGSFEAVNMDLGVRRHVLTAAEQRADIEFLLRGMQEVYAGRKVDPVLFEAYVRKMRGFQAATFDDITAEQFYYLLQFEIAMLDDGHLQFESWYKQRAANEARAPAVGRDYASREIHDSRLGPVHVFRMPMFNPPEFEEAERIVQMVEESLPHAGALIFDLRGNIGGFGFVPLQIAARLWGKPYRAGSIIQNFPQPVQEVGSLGGPYVHALIKNSAISGGTPYGRYIERQTGRGFVGRGMDRLFGWFSGGAAGEDVLKERWAVDSIDIPETRIEVNDKVVGHEGLYEKGFTKPIIVIVDKGCASACEMLLESLEEHPFATTWGERTMGAVQFGSTWTLVLPKSHLSISLPTSYTLYKDGRKPDVTGYTPEFPLPLTEGDPVKHIEGLIKAGRLPASRR
ncbi:MAG: hypothetical protein KF767_08485 [Bdellovibrionaceae bacterium]|nr:hypothetical protein [Pseudobdellovibrionaceae bacterium]